MCFHPGSGFDLCALPVILSGITNSGTPAYLSAILNARCGEMLLLRRRVRAVDSGRLESNQRPPAPKAGAIGDELAPDSLSKFVGRMRSGIRVIPVWWAGGSL